MDEHPAPQKAGHSTSPLWRQTIYRLVLALAILWAPQAVCVESAATSHPKPPAFSEQTLSSRVAELEKLDPRTETQTEELSWLIQAQLHMQKARDSVAHTARYEEDIRSAPTALRQAEAELARPFAAISPQLGAAENVEELTQQLNEAKIQLDAHRHSRSDAEDEAVQQSLRRQQIPDEMIYARKRLAEIRQAQAAAPDPQQTTEVNAARRLALEAEQEYLQNFLNEIDAELRSYDARRDLIRAQKQLAERRVLLSERLVSRLDEQLSGLRAHLAVETMRSAEEARLATTTAHPAVREIIEQNAVLAKELASISAKTQALVLEKQHTDDELSELLKSFSSSKGKIAQVGLTDAIGLRLRSQLLQLPDEAQLKRRLAKQRDAMDLVQLRRIELEDTLLALVDTKRTAERYLNESEHPVSEANREEALSSITQALDIQKTNYLSALIKAYDIYFDSTLLPLHESERQLSETARAYQEFIAERILWIQSTRPIGAQDLSRTWSAVAWLYDPALWEKTLRALALDLWSHPFSYLLFLLTFAALLRFRSKMRRQLDQLGVDATKPLKAKYNDTIMAAVLTLLIAAAWPFLLWLMSWRLYALEEGAFSTAAAAGLNRVAVITFSLELLRVLCRKNGLAEAHFRWPAMSIALVRRHMHWLIPTIIPLTFLVATTHAQPIEAYRDSLGRLAFIAAMIAGAVLVRSLFRPSGGILQPIIDENAGGWLDRLQYIWYPALIALPLALALAASFGYFYTALHLEQRIVNTLWIILVTIVAYALLLRWLYLEQRKLAIDQARKKLAAQAKARAEQAAAEKAAERPEGAPEPTPRPAPSPPSESALEEEALNLAVVSSQTRRLLRSLMTFSLIIGLYWVWKDVLPAFGILREYELWSVMVAATEQLNENTARAIQQAVPITLADLGQALIILAITVAVSKNIPGLLEILVLQRLPFSPSSRYAITTIARYVIVIIGMVLFFSVLGISWSKVQFLAAAITVGLGFGLQEIFANFVSGLIILFERQIRVGDAVTVGNISGRVSRIQMRATTITDWNHKELIIPNKEFVTGQVINWSLTDTTLRIDLPVGVAYGSDTELTIKTLLDIAGQNAHVLKDPPPQAVFCRFGDSSLDFELRVHIPHNEYLISTRHELLLAIDRAFRALGIEIAFPQRDIHIRTDNRSGEMARSPGIQ